MFGIDLRFMILHKTTVSMQGTLASFDWNVDPTIII